MLIGACNSMLYPFLPRQAGFLGSLKGAATDLYATQQSTGLLTDGGAAFMSFLQRTTPKILETKEDSRLDMETKLKTICMAFMQATSRAMTAPLQSFLVKVDALGVDAKKTLSSQAFATPEKVRALVAETTGQMRTQMASVTKSTSVYGIFDIVLGADSRGVLTATPLHRARVWRALRAQRALLCARACWMLTWFLCRFPSLCLGFDSTLQVPRHQDGPDPAGPDPGQHRRRV